MAEDLVISPVAIIASLICIFFQIFVLSRYLVPRENCKTKLRISLGVIFCLQILNRFCLMSDVAWVKEFTAARVLTLLIVWLYVFWCGAYVYGGWAKIGMYLIVIEVVFSVYERLYWLIWGALTHATAEEVTLRSQLLQLDLVTGIELLSETAVLALFLLPARKMRKLTFEQNKIVKAVVIVYLILGSIPVGDRTGFDNGVSWPTLAIVMVYVILFFFAVLMSQRKMERDSRQLLRLRQYAFAAQAETLGLQRQKIRRFRHDVKRHLDALTYLMKEKPELEKDPSFLQYRQELEHYRDVFRQGYYCESDELNAGISQIDQYCAAHGIPITIKLRRLQLTGWDRDEQLRFAALLYNLATSFRKEEIATLAISGDGVQGQNILSLEAEVRPDNVLGSGGIAGPDHEEQAQEYEKEMEKILSRHKGSGRKQKTERGISYTYLWSIDG